MLGTVHKTVYSQPPVPAPAVCRKNVSASTESLNSGTLHPVQTAFFLVLTQHTPDLAIHHEEAKV